MIEQLEDAGDELKRADHLVYVSLKYTRTADVLKNSLQRMIDSYEQMIEALLLYSQDVKGLKEIPKTPLEKGNLVKQMYDEQEIKDNVDLYFLLRKIIRSNYSTEQEYRRHVAIVTTVENREEIINIDIITQYLEFQKKFFSFVLEMLKDHAKKKHVEENGWEY
jgi:CTP synthase (UTP-ammonia lyase)